MIILFYLLNSLVIAQEVKLDRFIFRYGDNYNNIMNKISDTLVIESSDQGNYKTLRLYSPCEHDSTLLSYIGYLEFFENELISYEKAWNTYSDDEVYNMITVLHDLLNNIESFQKEFAISFDHELQPTKETRQIIFHTAKGKLIIDQYSNEQIKFVEIREQGEIYNDLLIRKKYFLLFHDLHNLIRPDSGENNVIINEFKNYDTAVGKMEEYKLKYLLQGYSAPTHKIIFFESSIL